MSLVCPTMASTGFFAFTSGELRTEVTVGISENWVARMVCAAGLVMTLMNVMSAAMFLLCGLMYKFQPPMLDVPGEGWPGNDGSGTTPTLPTTLDGDDLV